MEENKFKFPTEIVDLPSKGLLYPEGHPLASGKIEMKSSFTIPPVVQPQLSGRLNQQSALVAGQMESELHRS